VGEHWPLQELLSPLVRKWQWEWESEREKKETLDDCDTPGSTGNLAANRSKWAGLKDGADVAVEEDYCGGTMSQESDVTDTALGGKGTAMHR
jgi:hypothetical protein